MDKSLVARFLWLTVYMFKLSLYKFIKFQPLCIKLLTLTNKYRI